MKYSDPRTGEQRELKLFGPIVLGTLAVLAVLAVCGVLIGGCQSLDSTDAGQVAVVINGGPFDSKDQRETVEPSSGWKIPGLASDWHKYYADTQQRFVRISAAGADDPDTTQIKVPTRDGYLVTIEGLTNFHTVFTGADGDPALREFDLKFGQRTFGSDGKHVWEDEGWEEFLKAQVVPIIVSTFREEIGATECEDLISSCALVQQSAGGPVNISTDGSAVNDNQLSEVEQAVQAKLAQRIDTALGGEYLEGFQVNISHVALEPAVQARIDQAQAAFADVARAEAGARAAQAEARRIKTLARQYEQNDNYTQVRSVEECAAAQGCQVILGDVPGINVGR